MRHVESDRWVGEFAPDACGRWQYRVEAWVDRKASFRHELERKVEAGQADLSGELSEAAALWGRRADRGGGARVRRRRPLRGDARPASCGSTATASAPPSAPGTSSSRARGAASPASRSVLPELAELGFDVVYLPPIHPIGRTNRKGRNNALEAGPDDPGSPWAIGAEEGGHDAIHPELGTEEEFRSLVERRARARARDRARLRDPVLARPPVAGRAPGVVQPPPGRDAEVRGEPAEALPGHLQRQLRLGGLAGSSGTRSATSSSTGSGSASRSFRVDNPHTKPVPFWEWLIDEVRTEDPDVDLPRGGVHAAGDDGDAREGRLLAVLHLLHLEEHEVGAGRVHEPADALDAARVLPAELLRQHAGHPPRVPAARRPAGVRGAARARGDAVADVRDLLRLRALPRTCRCGRAARSTSTRRSTRRRSARSTGRCCRSSGG